MDGFNGLLSKLGLALQQVKLQVMLSKLMEEIHQRKQRCRKRLGQEQHPFE